MLATLVHQPFDRRGAGCSRSRWGCYRSSTSPAH